jgi:hypothetical protein
VRTSWLVRNDAEPGVADLRQSITAQRSYADRRKYPSNIRPKNERRILEGKFRNCLEKGIKIHFWENGQLTIDGRILDFAACLRVGIPRHDVSTFGTS